MAGKLERHTLRLRRRHPQGEVVDRRQGIIPHEIAQVLNYSADEPRRSVRATKGQHTKMDLLDQQTDIKKKTTKKGSKKQAAQEDGDEVEVIRCICGARATSPDDGEPWIACDKCHVWQHNICVGVSTFEDELPENYMCEECDQVYHKPLLDAITRGEKPWEDNRRVFKQRQQEEEDASKKKGKKGKGKRTSDPKSELSQASNGKAKSPSTPAPEAKKEKKEPTRAGNSKRKSTYDAESSKVGRMI
jgi:PHD-finger